MACHAEISYLEENVGTHGFTVSDDRLFIWTFSVPTIQFDTSIQIQKKNVIDFSFV